MLSTNLSFVFSTVIIGMLRDSDFLENIIACILWGGNLSLVL